ncbi:MAG: hypothetical protein ACYC2O_02915 [Microthrixaceae bacterium]
MRWVDDADRFVADRRAEDAAAARRRARWDGLQREELTTLAAALDAAVGQQVTLVLLTGARDAAVVAAVGADHVALRPRSSASMRWVALDGIAAIESAEPYSEDPESLARSELTLGDVLSDLCADRALVAVTLRGGAVLRGEVHAVGATLSLRADGPTPHVRIDTRAIVAIDLLGR